MYSSFEPLPTVGTFTTNVLSSDTQRRCTADFIVLDCNGSLLGKETTDFLRLLHVGPNACAKVGLNNMFCDVIDKFPLLFNGVGLSKNYELNLHIDTTVKPIAQPARKLPFQLRDKVERKLLELVEAYIIEEGPTGWISPLVVIPKSDGDVRLCIDMRRANEAIIRERYSIPRLRICSMT